MMLDKIESETVEEKSFFEGNKPQWLKIIKTITALSNTRGGVIRLYKLGLKATELDSAKIDDKINNYVEPKISNIKSQILKTYSKIEVENSRSKPHIFTKDGAFQDSKTMKEIKVFRKGEVIVRHSSKNEVANRDDYERIFDERIKEFMKRLNLVSQLPIDKPVRIEEIDSAMPIKIVEKGEGIPTIVKKTDPNKDFPYLTSNLSDKLGKSINFISKTTYVLKLKGNEKYHLEIKTGQTSSSQRYSEEALKYLKKYFQKNPKFNPFK